MLGDEYMGFFIISLYNSFFYVLHLHLKSLSRVRLFVTPQTVACQAPPSMGFSRQGYWSGVSLPSPKGRLSAALNK